MRPQKITRHVPFSIRRIEGDRALVEGIAYLSLDPEKGVSVPKSEAELRVDSWGTFMRRETLETMAHRFLEYARKADSQHDHGVIGDLVESYLTREGDPTYPPNVWVAKVKVHDADVIAQLDDGTLTGFSIEILASRRDVKIDVEGVGVVKVGELLDPIPLFLSLVDRPAINQPFTEITTVARVASAVTHVVRCAAPTGDTMPTDEETQPNTTDTTTTTATPATPAAARDTTARDARLAEHVQRFGVHGSAERAGEIVKRSADRTDFAATWAEIAPRLRAWSSLFDAICLFESTCWEIRYSVSDVAEMAARISKAGSDFATVVSAIMAELATSETATRTEQRAGRKISAARLDKIKTAMSCAGEASGHLAELIADVEGEPEGETTVEAKAAPAPVDATAELRAKLDAIEAARTEDAKALAQTRADLEAAQKRVEALETARPVARSEGDPTQPQAKVDDGKNWGKGTLFPTRR